MKKGLPLHPLLRVIAFFEIFEKKFCKNLRKIKSWHIFVALSAKYYLQGKRHVL
jgi:hypothetical protein